MADALADLADAGAIVRIGIDHRVIVLAADAAVLDRHLAAHPALAAAARPRPNVVACPGTRWCSRGLADTNTLGDRIAEALSSRPAANFADASLLIAISGCPNGCAHSAVADIGIVGGKNAVDGKTVEKYTVLAGGGKGATPALAQPVAAGLTAPQVVAEVVRLLQARQETHVQH
jgi:sulfite reductase (NADPH) hemoprotein beta-component